MPFRATRMPACGGRGQGCVCQGVLRLCGGVEKKQRGEERRRGAPPPASLCGRPARRSPRPRRPPRGATSLSCGRALVVRGVPPESWELTCALRGERRARARRGDAPFRLPDGEPPAVRVATHDEREGCGLEEVSRHRENFGTRSDARGRLGGGARADLFTAPQVLSRDERTPACGAMARGCSKMSITLFLRRPTRPGTIRVSSRARRRCE